METVKVLTFAGAREVIGAAELVFPIAGRCTAGELLRAVCARYPGLAPYAGSIRVAVNGSYAQAGDLVEPGAEVALIPPVAGG